MMELDFATSLMNFAAAALTLGAATSLFKKSLAMRFFT
jgi:hypothetical protein